MEMVRSKTGVPAGEDFRAAEGSPLVVDQTPTTGGVYYLDANGTAVKAGPISVTALTWSEKGAGFTAAADNAYRITANSVTATLPASPADNDLIGPFIPNASSVTGFVVARNGKTIMGLSEDMTVDVTNFTFSLVYSASAGDWRLA